MTTQKEESPITTELAKQNVTETVITNLKKNFLPLKINGVDDKEGYKKVHDARIQCRDIRVLTEKICKKGREEAVRVQKEWIAKEKEVVAQVSEVEQYLKKQEDAVDQEVENRKIRAERLLKLPGRKEQIVGLEKYLGRIADFIRVFTQQEIGGPITDEIIMRFTDEQWTQCLLLSKEAKLNEQQKEIDEQKAIDRQKRLIERTNALYKAGAISIMRFGIKNFHKGNIFIPEVDVADMENELWESKFNEIVNAQGETPIPEMKEPVTAKIQPTSGYKELTDEERLWNYANALERVPLPDVTSKGSVQMLSMARELLKEAIAILRK